MTPPRPLVDCETFADLLCTDPQTADLWFEQIAAMLPSHALRSSTSTSWRWTNQRGAWQLVVGKPVVDRPTHRGIGRPYVTLKRGWDSDSPDARWEVADLGLEHIQSVLVTLGAVGAPEGAP